MIRIVWPQKFQSIHRSCDIPLYGTGPADKLFPRSTELCGLGALTKTYGNKPQRMAKSTSPVLLLMPNFS